MAKSPRGTKKLNEALTPDQVSKVEDKYKSIYSGMLKGNKKKLMKYIDPKLKRPNPDAMAMGRAINLVKKETETVNENETLKLGVKYQLPTGETGYIMTGGSDDPRDWKFSGNKQPYLSVEDELTPLEKQPGKYDGAFDMGRGKGHHIDEELVNEYINPGYQIETKYFDPNEVKAVADQLQAITDIENIQYKEFKWADGTGGLSFTISSDYRDTGLDYFVRLEHTYDGKWKSKVFATYGAGASEVDLNIDMEGFTNMKDITKETFKGVWDKMLRAAAPALKSKRREMEAHQSKSNQSQRDFYKDRGQTSGTIDERLATLVKEVYSEKQRKWACSQDGPEFDEMCKDTAISKKKLKEERTSTVSKTRAKSELKQMLKGKRDDGMGKSTLKAVLAIDKDGKETKIKKLEDFDKFEKGTKFSLKETTMNNDRLTELIKAALTGPVKEDNFHSPRTVKNIPIGDEDEELTTVDLDWYEKKDEERSRKAGEDMRKNQNSLKEGVWSMGTVEEINRFIKDIKEMKNHYYDIVGSDDVFDGLDRAEMAAKELAMNAPENRGDLAEKQQRPDYPDIDGDGDTKEPMVKAAKDKEKGMNEELATTPIKDDIYAIGSRIYKDPYEAISLVATDQTVVVRDFARKDKKFKAAVMDYVKSKGLETSVDRDGLYIDTKPLDFKGIPLMNEKSLAESIFKKLRG